MSAPYCHHCERNHDGACSPPPVVDRCPCGEPLPLSPNASRGADVHCRCGRVYRRPAVDLERLCERIDALEREVAELRAWRERTR